jgi:hypothetical protein
MNPKEISFTQPNFEIEWDEAKRYSEFRSIGKSEWVSLAKTGKPTRIFRTDDINNTDAAATNSFNNLDKNKQKRALSQISTGVVEMPIVAVYSDGWKELIGGNTRLTALMNIYGEATVWIFEVLR